MIIACMYFAAVGAFAKVLSAEMSSVEVVFFRNLVGLILVLYAIYKKPPTNQKGGQFFVLMFRGFIGTVALFALFYNIAHINLGAAYTFQKTSPIFTAVLAAIFLKEALSYKGWGAIFLGFIGILFIVQPNLGISKSDWLGLWSGVGAALAMLSVRSLRKSYDTSVIVLSFMGWGTLLPMILMGTAEVVQFEPLDFLLSPFVMPSLKGVIFIVFMGLAGYFFQLYMTKAYAATKKAGIVAAVSYMDVVFSLMVGYLMGDGLPNSMAFFGIMLVILSGILVAREK
ncbi:DMT family transporter [Campylobacter sp. RM9344]|uniref:DMT family transporter n=2 Tax=Campylobacter californiensis TaxID=1032243 RepID=A0AAW3ZW41_9BACT|nr:MULTISPECIES: DMT family transporter [unclassified Campylobacter]MBE2986858.1 DMT family transporter [Campylobacter sp. RM12919]MBE2988583.1 DMT family transporter [Campylobacter sp. RM12920]MBE3022779.1 DMT family transporter [Campylobacter sp. 7477a]MBE3029718.1 DMT family transporter [Campylobacter sp. RM9344]MBE3606812.1 DMT family transporter [Campylobacter sp. RM13119]